MRISYRRTSTINQTGERFKLDKTNYDVILFEWNLTTYSFIKEYNIVIGFIKFESFPSLIDGGCSSVGNSHRCIVLTFRVNLRKNYEKTKVNWQSFRYLLYLFYLRLKLINFCSSEQRFKNNGFRFLVTVKKRNWLNGSGDGFYIGTSFSTQIWNSDIWTIVTI